MPSPADAAINHTGGERDGTASITGRSEHGGKEIVREYGHPIIDRGLFREHQPNCKSLDLPSVRMPGKDEGAPAQPVSKPTRDAAKPKLKLFGGRGQKGCQTNSAAGFNSANNSNRIKFLPHCCHGPPASNRTSGRPGGESQVISSWSTPFKTHEEAVRAAELLDSTTLPDSSESEDEHADGNGGDNCSATTDVGDNGDAATFGTNRKLLKAKRPSAKHAVAATLKLQPQPQPQPPLQPRPPGNLQNHLGEAVNKGQVDVARNLLVVHGADPSTPGPGTYFPPLYSASRNNHIGIAKLLLEHNSDPNKTTSDTGSTSMYIAAENGYTEIVKLLLDYNANPNLARTDQYGTTPVYMASSKGHADALKLMLEHSADPNQARTDFGTAPVFIAATRGNLEIVEILLGYNADVNQRRTSDGGTPVCMAAFKGHLSVVKMLLEHHAEPNKARTDNGTTPLYLAVQNGHSDVVKLLLEHNADPNQARTDNGSTPASVAAEKGRSAIVTMFKQHVPI